MTTARENVPTADEAFGFVVHEAMYRQRIKQVKLAATLKCHPTTLGKKLAGERPWALEDMIAVADALRVDLRDLLAEMWRDEPAGAMPRRRASDVELPRPDSNRQPFDYKANASTNVIDLAGRRARRDELVKSA